MSHTPLKQLNVVRILRIEDFPDAVSGVRTWAENTKYILDAPITTSDRFIIPAGSSNEIESSYGDGNILIYTGDDTVFTGTDIVACNFINLTVVGTSGNATLMDFTNVDFFIENVRCVYDGFAAFGTITNALFFILRNSSLSNFADGVILDDCDVFSFNSISYLNDVDTASTFITILNSASLFGEIRNSSLFTSANETAIDLDSSLTSALGINITGNIWTNSGNFFDPAGLDETSIIINVNDNSFQKDSKTIGSFHALDNTTATVISVAGTFVDFNLNALAQSSSNNERWTLTNTTTGELRYDGREDFTGVLFATMTVEKSGGGGAQAYEFKAVINGIDMVDDIHISEEVKTEADSFAIVLPVTASTNDLIKLQVSNPSSTVNIIVANISLNIQ